MAYFKNKERSKFSQLNILHGDNYIKDLDWLYLLLRDQEKQQMWHQQSYIPVSVAYLAYQSSK